MAKTISQYREILDNGGFRTAYVQEGWEDLVDNIIDYDGIAWPEGEELDDPGLDDRMWALRDEEERKVCIALREYLQDVIKEYVPEDRYYMNIEERGI